MVRNDRLDGKGGVAILVRSDLKFTEVSGPNFEKISFIGIKIKLKETQELSLVSVYIRPSTRISHQLWTQFFSIIKKPFLIGGDFNAHNQAWGCLENDIPGRILLESLDSNNIIYLNKGQFTRINPSGGNNSAVDITLTSPCFQPYIEWNTMNDSFGSDHIPIIMSCNISPTFIQFSEHKKWNTKNANWDNFYLECINSFSNANYPSYNEFISALNIILENCIPTHTQKKTLKKKIGKFWWNETCSEIVKNRKKIFAQYKNNPSLDNLIQLKRANAISKKVLKEEKKKNWFNYCTSINKNTPSAEIWQKINRFKNRKTSNYTPIMQEDEWIEDFHKNLTPSYAANRTLRSDQIPENSLGLIQPFDMEELKKVLKNKNNTAPGKDNIQYSMLSNLPMCALQCLLQIYNNIFNGSHPIPDEWKEYIIVPLLKPNKPKNVASSYRPIALASCLLKTYERMIKNRLEFWMEKNYKFPSTQKGFRRDCSTQEVIAELIVDVQQAFSEDESTSALFLDVQGAYDNVNFDTLVLKMTAIGLHPDLIKNIYELYNARLLFIRTNDGISDPRVARVGLPQGSILSPLLYVMYTYDLQSLSNMDLKILQFADDVCFYSKDKLLHNSIQKVKSAFKNINKWFFDNGLTISTGKSNLCIFTRKRTEIPNSIEIANNLHIPCKSSIKYLGILLDKKLLWKDHIQYVLKRVENSINIIRAFSHHNWGADPNASLMFYKAYVRSILDYGSIFYGSAAVTHLKKIETVKNRCLRLCIGFLKSTPIPVIEAETLEPPLYIRRNYLCDKFLLKLINKNSNIITKVHNLAMLTLTHPYWKSKKSPIITDSYLWMAEFKNDIFSSSNPFFGSLDVEFFKFISKILIERHEENPTLIKNNFLENLNTKWKNYEHIYTDGSLCNNKSGCAFYHQNRNIKRQFKLMDSTSIFSAELWAIWESLLYCLQYTDNTFFIVFSDSKSALESIKNSYYNYPSNYITINILKTLKDLSLSQKNVVLVWTKAHIGIVGNETVDKLAKEATTFPNFLEKFRIPHSDFVKVAKDKAKQNWRDYYSDSNKGYVYKNTFPTIGNKPWFSSESNKRFIKTLSRIRSGHILCPSYKNKIGLAQNDLCSCGEIGDINHHLLGCPNYSQINIKPFVDSVMDQGITFPFNIGYLMSTNNILVYKALFQLILKENIEV